MELKFIEQFIQDYQILNGVLIDSSQCLQDNDTTKFDGDASITSLFKDCVNTAIEGENGEIIPIASLNNSQYSTVEIKGDDEKTETQTSLYSDSDCTTPVTSGRYIVLGVGNVLYVDNGGLLTTHTC